MRGKEIAKDKDTVPVKLSCLTGTNTTVTMRTGRGVEKVLTDSNQELDILESTWTIKSMAMENFTTPTVLHTRVCVWYIYHVRMYLAINT